MENLKYTCYKCDEDLTAQVLAARVEVPLVKSFGFRMTEPAVSGGSWRVAVECSQGHTNIFEGKD